MKTTRKFFRRRQELKLEGFDKRLSNLAIIIVILSGLIYIINSTYILTKHYHKHYDFKSLGAILILGLFVSGGGIGFIVNRPPKQQFFWAILGSTLLILFSFYQFYYFDNKI